MKIRFSGGMVSRVKGTIDFPPNGVLLENALRQLCNDAGIRIPKLFSCSVPSED